ncbi:hypothetical protein GGS20DRAFT_483889 [Poronia punctata]|nr:hypothetical protein GGS20DRAFT_483889 [Poronia punctata]
MADPGGKCFLTDLPCELLLMICSLLPVRSVVCLTLTCKTVSSILGHSSWRSSDIREKWYPERIELLKMLCRDPVRDGVSLEYCYWCRVLHPSAPSPPAKYRKPGSRLRCGSGGPPMDNLPKSDSGDGYVVVFDHIRHTLQTVPVDSDAEIKYLAGEYQVSFPRLVWTVSTSARRVDGNLILRHRHVFRTSRSGSRIKTDHLMRLPVRICPHQSTSTERLPKNEYIKTARRNGPLFFYSIYVALHSKEPGPIKMPENTGFRHPTREEKRMMDLASYGQCDDTIFDCSRCPTKWKVDHDEEAERSEVAITVWHCFYDNPRTALSIWAGFVRRVDPIWRDDINSEFWSMTRGFSDFDIS